MEDAHAAILDLQTDDGKETKSSSADTRLSFFGVYDGHGGDRVALFAGDNIHQIIAKQEAFKKGDIEQALKDGFLATDRAILNGLRAYFRMGHKKLTLDLQIRGMRKKSLDVLLLWEFSQLRRFMWYEQSSFYSKLCVLITLGKCRRFSKCFGCEGSGKAALV